MATYGMKNVEIVESTNNTYLVKADTERFGLDEIMFESYKFIECIEWLEKNGVNVKYIHIDAPSAIVKIKHVSFLIDSYDIEYVDGFKQYKTGRYSLTNAEEDFMWKRRRTPKYEEHWIKNGGLSMSFTL